MQNQLTSLTFKKELTGSHHEQQDLSLYLYREQQLIGKLDYSIYQDTPSINMIEIVEDERRKGYATQLLQKLQTEYPDQQINWGLTTEDGTALQEAITIEITDEILAAQFQELENINQEIEQLEINIATNPVLLEQNANRWDELEDRKEQLEQRLNGKTPHKTLIILDDRKLRQKKRILTPNKRLQAIKNTPDKAQHNHRNPNPIKEYREQARAFLDTHPDKSITPEIDLQIITNMLILGFNEYNIQRSIKEASPVITLTNESSYAKDLVKQATKQPEVKKAINEWSVGIKIHQ